MADTTQPEGLTAVLLQLSGLTEKLSGLEHRQASDAREIRHRVTALAAAVEELRTAVAGHAGALAALDSLDQQVAGLARRLAHLDPDGGDNAAGSGGAGSGGADSGDDGGGAGYRPPASPRFWKLDGPARDQAVARLRAWVEQVYRPGYGHLAAGLAECWDQHPLCLYLVDWLSELWSVLYLAPARTPSTLAGQAEWHTRLLPAAAAQLARETRACPHHTAGRGPSGAGARA